MGRLYLIVDDGEIAPRRKKLPGRFIETWPDLYGEREYWMADESKAALDSAGTPIRAKLVVDADAVAVYYGPRLAAIDSLPREDSLRARVLSAHGIAVVCMTADTPAEGTSHSSQSPLDPVFFLRRPGGSAAHRWRLFTTKQDAVAWVLHSFPGDDEAAHWAHALLADSYEALLARHGAPG